MHITANTYGGVLPYQHLCRLFAHPEVYVYISLSIYIYIYVYIYILWLPALGLVSIGVQQLCQQRLDVELIFNISNCIIY